MRLPRTTTAIAAIAVAIALSTGTLAGASTIAKASPKHLALTSTPHAVATPTLHTARALVGGMTETILVNAKGLPLYTYEPDTATKSMVTGELAALWPPLLDSKAPTAKGITGKLTVVHTQNGRQVTYQGHFLYSFTEDTAGRVTGQGVQNFFVATPGISIERTVSSPTSNPSTSAESTTSPSSSNSNAYGSSPSPSSSNSNPYGY